MPTLPSTPAAIDSTEQMSGVYGRTFWLAYLANSVLIMANALTFRFAELVNHLGGAETDTGYIVASVFFIFATIPLTRYLDHLIASRERRERAQLA